MRFDKSAVSYLCLIAGASQLNLGTGFTTPSVVSRQQQYTAATTSTNSILEEQRRRSFESLFATVVADAVESDTQVDKPKIVSSDSTPLSQSGKFVHTFVGRCPSELSSILTWNAQCRLFCPQFNHYSDS